jgi:hypothetical protein
MSLAVGGFYISMQFFHFAQKYQPSLGFAPHGKVEALPYFGFLGFLTKFPRFSGKIPYYGSVM